VTDDAAALLTLVLTLLPGMHPEAGRDAAREALTKLGCTDARVAVAPGPLPKMHEVRARCVQLGPPEPPKVEP
jgi:hypothetical protein